MAERDLGSTFLLPHTHLYKPDRVSESNASLNFTERQNLTATTSHFVSSFIFREVTYLDSTLYKEMPFLTIQSHTKANIQQEHIIDESKTLTICDVSPYCDVNNC